MTKTRMIKPALEDFLAKRMRAYASGVQDVTVRLQDPAINGYTWDVVQITGDVSQDALERIEQQVIYPLQKKVDLTGE